VTGTAVPVLEDVGGTAVSGGDFMLSRSGTFVWLEGTGAAGTKIHWLDSSGKLEPLHAERGLYYTPRFSPNGKRLAFAMAAGSRTDLWVMDVDGGAPLRLSFLEGRNEWPVWLPDGEHIVFRSTDPKTPGMYWTRADAAGEALRLSDQINDFPHSITPDGKRVSFQRPGNGGSFDLFTAAIEGDPDHPKLGKPELFVGTPFIEVLGQFSPDGRWMAYMSQESGLAEVYVRPFPGPGGRWQISSGGGDSPLWSSNGRELLYEARDGRVMAVSYTATGAAFTPGRPRVWSERPVYQLAPVATWDLAPDGKRLAVILPESHEKPRPLTHLTFLLNFVDEIQRRTTGGEK
jgi:serine/threonine-protein kinase